MTICTSTDPRRRPVDPRMSRAAAALSVCGVMVLVIGGCATRGATCPPPAAGIPPAHVDPQPVALVTEDDKTLYALGKLLVRNLGTFTLDAREVQIVQAGLAENVLRQRPERVDLEVYGPKVDQLATARGNQRTIVEKARGAAYREAQAGQPGVEMLPSGVLTRAERLGDGATPKPTDRLSVSYQGQLIDGMVFDSSYRRGKPATFPLDGVIQCWREAVGRMRVGGKSRLVCPPETAYGDKGRPPSIPGGATLVFDVELISIEPPAATSEPAKPAQ